MPTAKRKQPKGPLPFYTRRELLKNLYLPEAWIEELGEPDEEWENPRIKNGPTMKMYRRERVEVFLSEPDRAEAYKTLLARRAPHSRAAAQAFRRKRALKEIGEENLRTSAEYFSRSAAVEYDKQCDPAAEAAQSLGRQPTDREVLMQYLRAHTNLYSLMDVLGERFGGDPKVLGPAIYRLTHRAARGCCHRLNLKWNWNRAPDGKPWVAKKKEGEARC